MPRCGNPNCEKPKRKLGYNEVHDLCLWCLGVDHDPYLCQLCCTMSNNALRRREKARQFRIAKGYWPSTIQNQNPEKDVEASSPTVVDTSPRSLPAGRTSQRVSTAKSVKTTVSSCASESIPLLTKQDLQQEFKLPQSGNIKVAKLLKVSEGPSQAQLSPDSKIIPVDEDIVQDPDLLFIQKPVTNDVDVQSDKGDDDVPDGVHVVQVHQPDDNHDQQLQSEDEVQQVVDQGTPNTQKRPLEVSESEQPVAKKPLLDLETFQKALMKGVSEQVAQQNLAFENKIMAMLQKFVPQEVTEQAQGTEQAQVTNPITDSDKSKGKGVGKSSVRPEQTTKPVKSIKSVRSVQSSRTVKSVSSASLQPSKGAPLQPSYVPDHQVPTNSDGLVRSAPIRPDLLLSDHSSDEDDCDFDSASSSDSQSHNITERNKQRASRRRKWTKTVYAALPHRLSRPKEVVSEDEGAWMFGEEERAKKSITFPIYKGIVKQVQKRVKQHFKPKTSTSSRKPATFNPVNAYNKSYRTDEPDHTVFSRPHAVSQMLIEEVREKKWLSNATPSHEARIDPNKVWGAREKANIEHEMFALTSFRISNALSLGVQALSALAVALRQNLGRYKSLPPLDRQESLSMQKIKDREQQFAEFSSEVSQTLATMSEGFQDVARCSGDLFNMNVNTYINAVADRRKTWLEVTNLPKYIQDGLNKLPIEVHNPTSGKSPDLLGPEVTERLTEIRSARAVEANKNIIDFARTGAAVQSMLFKQRGSKTQNVSQNRQKKGNQGKPNTNIQQKPVLPVTPDPDLRFPSGANPNRGRGGGRGRGRGRGKPKSNRGKPTQGPNQQ